jgi:hypothetical protein
MRDKVMSMTDELCMIWDWSMLDCSVNSCDEARRVVGIKAYHSGDGKGRLYESPDINCNG